MLKCWTYEDIDSLSYDELKQAKMLLMTKVSSLKSLIQESRSKLESDPSALLRIELNKLVKNRRHFVRLLTRVEVRIIECKANKKESDRPISEDNQQRARDNIQLKAVLKPRPFHAVFCFLAYEMLPEDIYEKIATESANCLEEMKSALD